MKDSFMKTTTGFVQVKFRWLDRVKRGRIWFWLKHACGIFSWRNPHIHYRWLPSRSSLFFTLWKKCLNALLIYCYCWCANEILFFKLQMKTCCFVRDKLSEWDLSELIQRFEGKVLQCFHYDGVTLKYCCTVMRRCVCVNSSLCRRRHWWGNFSKSQGVRQHQLPDP